MSTRENDRRRSQRQRRRLDVRFWNDEVECRGFTTNVSNKGMLIETTKTLPLGLRLHLEILLDGTSFFAEGVVVRRKSYPPQARSMFKPTVGVRFVSLREVVRSIMAGEPESADGTLKVDLSDPARLKQVYERDIKYGGLLVHTRQRPELHSEVRITMVLPRPHAPVECCGSVVKLHHDPASVALRIAEVDQVRGKLSEIIGDS